MDIYNIYEKKILEVLKSKTAKHEEEMMKSNFVQLSWNDTSKKVLEAGTYIVPFADGVKYRLLDDYEPKQKTEACFEYAPEFQHPIMMLGKIPFILTTGDTTSFQTADKETDWVYTGVASTIIQKIVDYINIIGAEIPDIGTGWFAVIDADIIGSKTCTFSAMDVLSAISECCNQWSCEYYLHYETKALYFGKVGIGDAVTLKVGENIGIPSVSESKEGYYNAFLVKGSTRNISQRSASGENTSVNKRLTLDPVKYPYGYIDKRENTAEPLMVKELIFEEVYPKLDLYVYNPRCRTRYLKDDDGNTVPDIDGKPKKYAVWYIRLAYLQNGVWMDYKITDDVVLSNKYQADNVGYYYNRYGNADHLTYKYAVFTNADFDAKWFTNKVTCQTSYSQYYVTVKAGDIVETAIAINNNGTLVLLIGESYTNYNSARNDSRGKAFRLAAQKDGIILQKYITEANIPSNYRHSQILDGMELSMSFQANENENALPSPLAGQEFKLRYHKDAKTIRANTEDGDSGMSVLAGDFEIVFEEGDIIIPTTIDGELYPRGERTPSLTGNKAILFNLAMDERYKAQAYLDLEMTANKEIERLCSDLNNYTFPSNPVVFEKELTNPHLHVGMKVKYDDGQGYTLDTRVLKLVTQLDFEFKQSITVGNGQIKGTISELREQIQQISTGGGGTGSGGGVNISELKNMLMYYGRNYFLSKQSDDYTPYNIGIGKTLNVGENVNVGKDLHVDGNAKVDGDVDIDGFLKVLAAYISKIQSSNYTGDGLNDTGFKITNDKDGHSYLVVDELLVRMKAVFNELEVRKMTYSGGNVVYSGAGSKIFRVEYLKKASPDAEDGEVLGYTVVKVPWLLYGSPLAIENYVLGSRKKVRTEVNMAEVTHFRCYLIADDGTMATTNWWEAYDQARCQTFNLSKNGRNAANGTDSVNTYGIDESNLQNNFYWRLVSRVGQQRLEDDKVYNYVDLSKTDCLAGSGIPVAGDSIVQFGNRSKVERQNVITLEVIGEDAPAIKEYMGINSYDLTNKRRTMISPRSGDEFYATRFVIVTSYGAQYPVAVDRGLWLNIPLDVKGNRRCYYYDRVSHSGSTWLCMVADGWHYEDANGNVVSSDTEGAIRTRNYTTDEPSLTSQDWQISVEKGDTGLRGNFKSTVFKRTNTKPATPSGGTYDSPVPSGWSDGIPAGTAQIWASSCTFYGNGGSSGWSTPQPQSDTDTLDIEFSPSSTEPSAPSGNTPFANHEAEGWYDPSSANFATAGTMIWRAERKVSNGEYDGSWVITRIYGEKGNPGNNAKGTKMRFTAAMSASATAPTLATVNNFTWYDTAPSPTESYPCVYCSIWEINYDGSLVQCLSVSLFNRYGKTGNNGSDAYSFQLSAPSVIIGQATTSPYSMLIDGTPTGNTATSIIVRKGNKACTVNITSLSTYHCNASRTYGGTTYSNIFWITAVLTDSNSKYYETGYVEVTFTVTDPDNSSNTFSTTLRFNFYCNLMGTWKTTIEGDVERSVATKIEYLYSDDNPNKVVKNADFVRSSSEMSSTIKRTLERLGENLIGNDLSKWLCGNSSGSVVYDNDNFYVQDTYSSDLYSPVVFLEQGKQYCFSFYAEKNIFVNSVSGDANLCICYDYFEHDDINDYYNANTLNVSVIVNEKDYYIDTFGKTIYRHYFVFSPYHEDGFYTINFWSSSRVYRPKLELGSVPSDYDVNNMKMTSESVVRQLADQIYLRIVNALGETGIYIDGTTRHIDLIASLVTISESLMAKALLTENDYSQVSIQGGNMEFKSKINQTRILFGIDDNGNAVLNYYGSNGNFLYGLGPNKIFETKSQAESMTMMYYDVDEGSTNAGQLEEADIVWLYLYIFKNQTPPSNVATPLYRYLAKITADQYGPGDYCASSADASKYNGKILKSYSKTTKLSDSDLYGGGIAVTSGRTQGGIIKYKENLGEISDIEDAGFSVMQDSDFNRILENGVYNYMTTEGYSTVCAFYWDRYNGNIGYNGSVYSQWQNLNLCTSPDDDDTLIDPLYHFSLQALDSDGNKTFIPLYINKSKLEQILRNNNQRL